MMSCVSRLSRLGLLAAVGVTALVMPLVMQQGSAEAAKGPPTHITTCRTDPTVSLSDGNVLVMYADITDSITDVQHVSYTVHVPVGITATKITYDSTGYLESVTMVADQQPGHGYSDTIVTTGTANVAVTAYSSVQGIAKAHVSGLSGQHLIASM